MSSKAHTQTAKLETSTQAGIHNGALLAERPFRRAQDDVQDNDLSSREQSHYGTPASPNNQNPDHNLGRVSIHSRRSSGIQPKLKVSDPHDVYEQEADRVADQVMRMPEQAIQRKPDKPSSESSSREDEEKIQAKPLAVTSLIQRQKESDENETEEENIQTKRSAEPVTVQRQLTEGEKDEKTDEKNEEEETIQPKTLLDRSVTLVQKQADAEAEDEEEPLQSKKEESKSFTDPRGLAGHLDEIQGNGRPLPDSVRLFFEPRFGHDFSRVRVHDDSRASVAASKLNAYAFTRGHDIVFRSGQYAPETPSGKQLLAHELTHVVQQGASPSLTKTIQREEEGYEEPVFEPTDADLEAEEEGAEIEQTGVVQTDDGANLWQETNRNKPKLGLLPQNTRVFVDRNVGNGWYSVYVEGHQRGEPLPVSAGTQGYLEGSRVNLDMPDPDAWLYRVRTDGQGALELAAELYPNYAPDCKLVVAACRDWRYLVNVLVMVNEAKGRRFLYKENPGDDWDKAKVQKATLAASGKYSGGQIWVPGMALVKALEGQVNSGSVSYEVLSTLADIGIGVAAFIVGLLHGALMSIADIFIGVYDLIKMAVEIITKLFKGTLISDAKAFFEEVSNIKVSDIIDMVGAKWNHPNVWDRWNFRGYVVGYAVVEILLLIFSVGIVTAVKWAGKVGKFGKLAEYLSKLPKIQKIIEAAKALKGKGVDKIRAALKAAHALSEAHGWAARVLRIPLEILHRLSEADIGKLKNLPQWARERFARLARPAMLRILGCNSP